MFNSCKKDLISSSNQALIFSEDTVVFDTVFSTIGSITKRIKIFNTTNKDLNIQKIKLPSLSASNYRFNIDGLSGPEVSDLLIRAKDSLFIFIEVTVDPLNANTPMIVTDSIEFMLEDQNTYLHLVAWGWDAFYHTPNAQRIFLDQNNDTIRFDYYSVTCNDVWNNTKPHIIYGYAIVEPGCLLEIDAGVQVYSYSNSGIIVGSPFEITTPSSLKINGTAQEPVLFTHTRLDEFYKEDPGLWDRIWLTANSIDNEILHAEIKNGRIGLQVDSNLNSNATLTLKNSYIHNHASLGILGQGSKINAENCIVTNCGQYLTALTLGGDYNFTHCTFANNWSFSSRSTPSIVINNYYETSNDQIISRDLLAANFINCIIYGNQLEELSIDEDDGAQFNYEFKHCALTTELNTTEYNFSNCILNPSNVIVDGVSQNPFFIDLENKDYRLIENSVAIDQGLSTTVMLDFDQNSRDALPDLGAFEFSP